MEKFFSVCVCVFCVQRNRFMKWIGKVTEKEGVIRPKTFKQNINNIFSPFHNINNSYVSTPRQLNLIMCSFSIYYNNQTFCNT